MLWLKEGKAHNFALTLPEHRADQAEEMLKSSYHPEVGHAGIQFAHRGCVRQPRVAA